MRPKLKITDPNPVAPLVVERNGESTTHRTIKSAVARWLFEIGLREVATEVAIGSSIIDIVAATSGLTPTKAGKLVERASRKSATRVPFSVVIEVKATRSDHLRDAVRSDAGPMFRKSGKYQWLDGMVAMAFVAAPAGVVKPNEVPAGWGILTYDDATGAVRRAQSARYTPGRRSLSSEIAETWTRNAMFADLRRAELAVRRARVNRRIRRPKCGECAHFTGPRRRSKLHPDPRGACSSVPCRDKLGQYGGGVLLERLSPKDHHCGGRFFEVTDARTPDRSNRSGIAGAEPTRGVPDGP